MIKENNLILDVCRSLEKKMRFSIHDKFLRLVLIIFSGLMLIATNILTQNRHGSILYHKYYRKTPQHTAHHDHQVIGDSEDEAFSHHFHSNLVKSAPVLHIASSYTKFNEVIPRTVYSENMIVNGLYHQNVIIILAEIHQIVLEQNLIMSCQISDQLSTHLEVVPDPIMKWIKTYKRSTHFFAMIYCFGFRKKTIKTDRTVNVIYKTSTNGSYKSVSAENSLISKLHTTVPTSNSLVVCATMYGHPARFDEWLRYQKTIGVDMVHISAQISFVVTMEQYSFLAESLKNGFVKIQVWKEYLKANEIFYHSQSLIYQDCIMQYRHSFEYAMLIDYDDFFIPAVSKKTNIRYYLEHLFSTNTASIKLPWIQYHCMPKNYTFLIDGNITRVLIGQDLNKRLESKSIHRLSAVEVVSIHVAYKVKSGYSIEKINGVNVAYFAHIRPNRQHCKVNYQQQAEIHEPG